MAKGSKKGTKPPPTNKPAEIVRQYSESHQFLKAKKAPKGAGFAFADGEVKYEQQPQDTGPPLVARTRSQARFLPVNLPRPGRRSQKLPPPASPQRQPSIKVPTHCEAHAISSSTLVRYD